MVKCPYCGRVISESERHCWYCEQDISKTIDEAEKPDIELPRIKLPKKKKGKG